MRPHDFQFPIKRKKRMAAIESAVNVVAGYLINVWLVYVVFRWLGHGVAMSESAGVGVVFASLLRSNGWRGGGGRAAWLRNRWAVTRSHRWTRMPMCCWV